MAVIPGGVSGRLYNRHNKDQIDDYISGEEVFWWFSDEAILEHSRASVTLRP